MQRNAATGPTKVDPQGLEYRKAGPGWAYSIGYIKALLAAVSAGEG